VGSVGDDDNALAGSQISACKDELSARRGPLARLDQESQRRNGLLPTARASFPAFP